MDVSSHGLFLLQQLNVQREFGFLCDCTVAIGNVYFKAHRAVLAAFSNYFKMIFIHQSSECIKIQPTDIQPDVFSYLLHIMYTGLCPKQPVDQARLQDGIKFLHAYQLCRKPGESAADVAAADVVRMSNLYGIQISSQLANKEGSGAPKGTTASRGGRAVVGGGAEGGGSRSRSSGRAGRSSHAQLSLAAGLDGGGVGGGGGPGAMSSVASGDDSDISARIKQERVEEDEDAEEGQGLLGGSPPGPFQGLLFKGGSLALLCPRCGERCSSPEGLRDHLFSHAACALDPGRLMEGLTQGGVGGGGGEPGGRAEEEGEGGPGPREQLDAGCLEEALRQSQALANELAAELRRSRGGGGGGGGGGGASPPSAPAAAAIVHSRKRKIACAVCSARFSHKSQLQEHMYTHTGKPSRYHRYNRLCSQVIHSSGGHFCEGPLEVGGGVGGGGGGGGATAGAAALLEDVNRDNQDNGSSCYSLDSEISQESVDGVPLE